MTAVAMTDRDRGRLRAPQRRSGRGRPRRSALHADRVPARRRRHATACSTRSRGRGRWRSSPSWRSSAVSPRLNFAAASANGSASPRRPKRLGWRATMSPSVVPAVGLAALFLYPLALLLILGSGRSLKWVDSYGIQILIYVMLGWGLNIVVGLAGLLDLGYVAFYAVGAYSYALLATTFGLSFWICLPLAGILAALWGVMLGFPVLRLRGDYLAIVTLAFGEIIRTILVNWVDFTGGGAGIASIPKITFFGLRFADTPRRLRQVLPHGLLADPRQDVPLLRDPVPGADHQSRVDASAPAADRARLGGAARGRDRLPLARHQHHQHQAHRLRARRLLRRPRRLLLRRAAGLHQPGELHLHRVRRPSSPSSSSAAWARRSASPWRRCS